MCDANSSEVLASLAARGPIDLVVVGGGIVGAGIARDAAMRGLRTVLVDRHDFAFGTSSRSSRLLHGGMRYLAQGRVGLVREASIEKRVVQKIAPHLAAPLAFVFPTYRDRGWPLWQLRVGVKIYDLLCQGGNFARSTSHSATDTVRLVPGLDEAGLAGAVRYFDGFTHDARLVLDTLRSASRAGATVANYTEFLDAQRDGKGWSVRLRDVELGREFSLNCRAVVNATGPWAAALPHSSVRMRCTKGVHLVFDHSRLAVTDAVAVTEGSRILFLIPWGKRTIVGTTDTDFFGAPESVRVEPADVDYLLGIANRYFPRHKLAREDIVGGWAGVRPLLEDGSGKPSDISRSHQIYRPEPGWWDVAGGKLTTYRLMAEQTVDQVSAHLGGNHAPCRTADEPLLPAGAVGPASGLVPPPVTRELVEYLVREEWGLRLGDVMDRRTSWSYYHRDARSIARLVAQWMAEILHWSPKQMELECDRYEKSRSQLDVPPA